MRVLIDPPFNSSAQTNGSVRRDCEESVLFSLWYAHVMHLSSPLSMKGTFVRIHLSVYI